MRTLYELALHDYQYEIIRPPVRVCVQCSASAFCAMDKYLKIRKIGEGAFGNAFLVEEKDKDRQMVMKEINMTKVISRARHHFIRQSVVHT